MRYFTLINNSGDTLDITTKDIFFNEVAGLGFEEETSFRHVGEMWWLNTASYRQKPITGKILFNCCDGIDPYHAYREFAKFIKKAPLVIVYYPSGLGGPEYRRRVRVTKLEKSELNTYGVLEEAIEFTPYTPWYEIVIQENSTSGEGYSGRWIWGDGDENPPVIFAPTPEGATPPRFGAEPMQWVSLDVVSGEDSPSRLIIYGPAINPIWTHYVDGAVVATGEFAESVTIDNGEALVIDNTDEISRIKVYNCYEVDGELQLGEELRDLYQKRNFSTACFITLRPGRNRIALSSSSSGATAHLRIEGYIYYATV